MSKAELITKREYRLVATWTAAILALYAAACVFGVRQLDEYRAETAAKREAWLASTMTAPGDAARAATASAGAQPVDVSVGILVNHVGEFRLRDAVWSADFDIWFRWLGEEVSPGETFRIVDGQIELCEKTAAETSGSQHYERYHVRARMDRIIDPARFPCASSTLGIQVEDRGSETVRYVADERWSRVAPVAVPSVLRLVQTVTAVRVEDRGPAGGGLATEDKASPVKPRFVFAMLVAPNFGMHYFMFFQGLFASVVVSLLVFFIKPTHVDPRFGLAIGGFFAAVGSKIAIASELPQVDRITLVNMVTGIGLATILLTLAQSTISLYVFDTMGRERLSRLFDYASIAAILIGYAVSNIALPMAARM